MWGKGRRLFINSDEHRTRQPGLTLHCHGDNDHIFLQSALIESLSFYKASQEHLFFTVRDERKCEIQTMQRLSSFAARQNNNSSALMI